MNDEPHKWQSEAASRENPNRQQAQNPPSYQQQTPKPPPIWDQYQQPPQQYPMMWQQPQDFVTQDVRQLAMIMHLLQFVGIPGLIATIILWQQKKENPFIDAHGKMIVNWFISHLIYTIVFIILSFLLIGIPFLIATIICVIVFPIIGAVKANNGEHWNYPMTIKFIS